MEAIVARDSWESKESKIVISGSKNLSKEDIERMVKDAQSHEADDKKMKEIIDTRNQADQIIFSTEKAIKEYGDKVSAEDKAKIEEAVKELKEVKEKDDLDAIKKSMDNLQNVAHKLAEEMYKNTQAGQQTGAQDATGNEKKDDDVVDAEVVN